MVFWGSEIGGEGCVCGIFPSLLLLAYARQGENTKHLTKKLGDGAPVGREQSKEHRESI